MPNVIASSRATLNNSPARESLSCRIKLRSVIYRLGTLTCCDCSQARAAGCLSRISRCGPQVAGQSQEPTSIHLLGQPSSLDGKHPFLWSRHIDG